MPRLNLKVVGNLLYSDVVDSSPRYAREAIMPSSSTVENFLRFQVQDKHNASYFSKMSWSGKTFPSAKLTKIFENERIAEKKFQITKLPTRRGRSCRGKGISHTRYTKYRRRRCYVSTPLEVFAKEFVKALFLS